MHFFSVIVSWKVVFSRFFSFLPFFLLLFLYLHFFTWLNYPPQRTSLTDSTMTSRTATPQLVRSTPSPSPLTMALFITHSISSRLHHNHHPKLPLFLRRAWEIRPDSPRTSWKLREENPICFGGAWARRRLRPLASFLQHRHSTSCDGTRTSFSLFLSFSCVIFYAFCFSLLPIFHLHTSPKLNWHTSHISLDLRSTHFNKFTHHTLDTLLPLHISHILLKLDISHFNEFTNLTHFTWFTHLTHFT